MSELKEFQLAFINLALESKALEFGNFTLKSGRNSPYFFNAAKMLNGCNLYQLASCYMKAIAETNIEFDSIYGPAYKGIFLGSMVAMMFSKEGNSYPLSFNRKEIKDHGEGGNIIGPEPHGNVMIIDDVLSAGTAARESIMLINSFNATPKVFIIGLDRQEKGASDISAKAELEEEFNITVTSIINLDALIQFLKNNDGLNSYLGQLEEYRHVWGA
jgi:orotate phosphoribosyltransferase|tara:strand:- start:1305 stop:1952 length:648 start_codon:yes stop_codon:yes gene_type:complete